MEEKNKDIEQEEIMPSFVYRDGMLADKEYVAWLANVKARYRQSQIKASVRVNTTMLEFYWSIGRDLVRMRAEQKWGAGVVKQFALDMRQAFPNEKGFSYSNVKDMKRWYLFYYERIIKGQQVVGLLENEKGHQVGDELEVAISQRVIDEMRQFSIIQKNNQDVGQETSPSDVRNFPDFGTLTRTTIFIETSSSPCFYKRFVPEYLSIGFVGQ